MNVTAKRILLDTIIKIDGAYAPSTIRSYKANFERFIQYWDAHQLTAIPAESDTIAQFIAMLTDLGLKSSSIRIAVTAISALHRLNDLPDPTASTDVKLAMRRMHRQLGRNAKQAYDITKPILDRMLSTTNNSFRGIRDRALLLIAYESLCRRSELASLQIEDIIENEGMAIIKLRRSKTDQNACGRWIKVSAKTLEAINEWIDRAKIEEGFLLRGIKNSGDITEGINPNQITRIYKRIAKSAQLPKNIYSQISGHSMRVGAAQDLLLSGATLPQIMNKGGWSKADTVMRYVEITGINLGLI